MAAGRAVTSVKPAGALEIPDQDCVIEPHTVVDLASSVDGIVESVEVQRGDVVEPQQVLVKLDAGVERAAVEYANARANAAAQVRAGAVNADFAARRGKRVESLHKQNVASSDQLDEAKTQAKLTRAQLEQAEENRRLAQLELRMRSSSTRASAAMSAGPRTASIARSTRACARSSVRARSTRSSRRVAPRS